MHVDPPDASHHQHRTAADSWDREYAGGRYVDEPPVPFVDDILNATRKAGITIGLYIGCGNGSLRRGSGHIVPPGCAGRTYDLSHFLTPAS